MNPQNINYLQPSGFKVIIDRRSLGHAEYFVQSVNLPGVSTNAVEVPFRQYTSIPRVADSFTFDALDLNIVMDEDMKTYQELFNWMTRNVRNNQKGNEDPDFTYGDITILIMTSKNNINKTVKFYDAFPIAIGGINMETTQGSEQVINFSATFRYSRFEIS